MFGGVLPSPGLMSSLGFSGGVPPSPPPGPISPPGVPPGVPPIVAGRVANMNGPSNPVPSLAATDDCTLDE